MRCLAIITLTMVPPALAEQLVAEVKRLQQELVHTRTKLQVAENSLRNMPSEGI